MRGRENDETKRNKINEAKGSWLKAANIINHLRSFAQRAKKPQFNGFYFYLRANTNVGIGSGF